MPTWIVNDKIRDRLYIEGSEGFICDMQLEECELHERQQVRDHAVKIVRAVNSHEALVGALELAHATIERLAQTHGPFSSVQGTYDVIDNALALARTV